MKLFYRTQGHGSPLLILHGLWGASDNWLPVAHRLSDQFQVILPDLRNHGQSPHAPEMDYHTLCDDLITFIQSLALPVPPHIVGHSMGGKIVMTLLLKHPEWVRQAVIVDIAPVNYSLTQANDHKRLLEFLATCDLTTLPTREELTRAIRDHFPDPREQQLLLKNCRKTAHGFEWKINSSALLRHFPDLLSFPADLPLKSYPQEILFVKGENSPYISHLTELYSVFPAARLQELPRCGHWIHSEQPEALAHAIRTFISR